MFLKTCKVLALSVLIGAGTLWAVRNQRAAHLLRADPIEPTSQQQRTSGQRAHSDIPQSVRFNDDSSRGLVVSVWINGAGRFEFAVDTGVGTTIISARVAEQAKISTTGRRVDIGGLAGGGTLTGTEVTVDSVAIGSPGNRLPSTLPAIIANNLPPGIDGILEPTDAFRPFGYTIDMPRQEIRAFDPKVSPLSAADASPDGAVVKWILADASRRPYVMLDIGKPALIDTGSSLGLGVTESAARSAGISEAGANSMRTVRDVGQGSFSSRRVRASTVSIGQLLLRNIPTDIIGSATPDAPIILGRDALRPFLMSFDPVHRLILITPSRG